MERPELSAAVEAMLFAAGEPLSVAELNRALARTEGGAGPASDTERARALAEVIEALKTRWSESAGHGFVLVDVGEGLAFRTHPRFAGAVQAMREDRPARLSRAALETLAIIAYRQPVTKPDIDHIRGVDSSAPLHLLLDRDLIRIAGKKEEPGRPLLYATTREFLSFFNLNSLAQLPSLREYHELTDDSREEVDRFDEGDMQALRRQARPLGDDDEPGARDLEEAMAGLRAAEGKARDELAAQGIALVPPPEPTSEAGPRAPAAAVTPASVPRTTDAAPAGDATRPDAE